MDQPDDTRETLQDLTRPAHLLVWSLRAIALGHDPCPVLIRTFRQALGPMGGYGFAAYQVVVKTIGMTGRRRLQVHVPGCACVSADERAIVDVIAAAEASLDGDERPLRAQLRDLIETEPSESLVLSAQMVARLMQAAGHRLARTSASPSSTSPEPPATAPTLH